MTTKTAQFTPVCTCQAVREYYDTGIGGMFEDKVKLCPFHTAAPVMYGALAKLRLEAIHYRNTGVGVQFLNHAIDQAELAINQVWGEGESNYDTEREG